MVRRIPVEQKGLEGEVEGGTKEYRKAVMVEMMTTTDDEDVRMDSRGV
jgi:hypothetical protein